MRHDRRPMWYMMRPLSCKYLCNVPYSSSQIPFLWQRRGITEGRRPSDSLHSHSKRYIIYISPEERRMERACAGIPLLSMSRFPRRRAKVMRGTAGHTKRMFLLYRSKNTSLQRFRVKWGLSCVIGPLGRQGPAATLRQHCPQMTQRCCSQDGNNNFQRAFSDKDFQNSFLRRVDPAEEMP